MLLPAGAPLPDGGSGLPTAGARSAAEGFGAIAIAKGLGSDEIAAGALLMGVIFIVLGRLGLLDLAARGFPRALIRGVQLTVGLLFLKIAWGLVTEPPKGFREHSLSAEWALPLALLVLVAAFAFRSRPITLVLVGTGAVLMVVLAGDEVAFGPSALSVPHLDSATFWTAFTVLVVPQVPLSFANSCLATADAARVYFGKAADRVRPGRLGDDLRFREPVCGRHLGDARLPRRGRPDRPLRFGARTAAAPAAMGVLLLTLALALGTGLAGLLAAFPLPILAGVLATRESSTSCCCEILPALATGSWRSSSASSGSR